MAHAARAYCWRSSSHSGNIKGFFLILRNASFIRIARPVLFYFKMLSNSVA
jgi:hypothetical protein